MRVLYRASILQYWPHHTHISCFLHILGAGEKSSTQETKGSISFSENIADMRIPFQIICNCYAKVFDGLSEYLISTEVSEYLVSTEVSDNYESKIVSARD